MPARKHPAQNQGISPLAAPRDQISWRAFVATCMLPATCCDDPSSVILPSSRAAPPVAARDLYVQNASRATPWGGGHFSADRDCVSEIAGRCCSPHSTMDRGSTRRSEVRLTSSGPPQALIGRSADSLALDTIGSYARPAHSPAASTARRRIACRRTPRSSAGTSSLPPTVP